MRRTQTVLVALTAAAVLAAPAWAASSRSLSTESKQVRAGQRLKLSGKDCRSRASVRIYLSGMRIEPSAPTAWADSRSSSRSRARPTSAATRSRRAAAATGWALRVPHC
jgi:hypothetical protein